MTKIVVPHTQGAKADGEVIQVVQRELFSVPTRVWEESRTGTSVFRSRGKAVIVVFICDPHALGGLITDGLKGSR